MFPPIVDQVCVERFPHLASSSDGFLQKFRSLKELKLHGNAAAIQLSTFLSLTNVEKLTVTDDFSHLPFSSLTKLRDLRITGPFSHISTAGLDGLTALAVARITTDASSYRRVPVNPQYYDPSIGFNITHLDADSNYILTNLRKLKLDYLENAHGILGFTNLTSLKVSTSPYPCPFPPELTCLQKLVELKGDSNRLRGTTNIISRLTNLRLLEIPTQGVSMRDITHLTSLASLRLSRHSAEDPHFSVLSTLTQLTAVDCAFCKFCGKDIFPSMKSLTSIKNLRGEVKERDLIHLSSSLRSLSTSNDTQLRVSSFTNLTNLKISTSMMTGESISSLTNLRKLKVSQQSSILPADIVVLTNLEDLKYYSRNFPDSYVECLPKLTKLVRLKTSTKRYRKYDIVEKLVLQEQDVAKIVYK